MEHKAIEKVPDTPVTGKHQLDVGKDLHVVEEEAENASPGLEQSEHSDIKDPSKRDTDIEMDPIVTNTEQPVTSTEQPVTSTATVESETPASSES